MYKQRKYTLNLITSLLSVYDELEDLWGTVSVDDPGFPDMPPLTEDITIFRQYVLSDQQYHIHGPKGVDISDNFENLLFEIDMINTALDEYSRAGLSGTAEHNNLLHRLCVLERRL